MKRAILLALAAIFFGGIFASSGATASPPSGPVKIVTEIDFSTRPFHGTVKVEEGADILGCSAGTFVDSDNGFGGIDKAFTCTRGGTGSFTVNARPCALGFDPETNTCTGNWSVNSSGSTGDFVGLHGAGDFSVVFDAKKPRGMETLTGVIHYD